MNSDNIMETEPTIPIKPIRKREAKDLTWSNVNFFVGDKPILKDCWGEVKVGSVAAILGPSGAGKSSLLNVLAGRSASGGDVRISGAVKVGGREINPVQFRRNIAYVMQDDCLLPTATPREALRFSASLRLPSHVTNMEITDRVEKLLEELGLLDCANVCVGGELKKGISGGQRKRTSVGVEIITEPTLLLLDEPTSGLDSFSAYNLIKLLQQIASNCAILCTIHQPSADIFFLFDKAIFLKDGQVVYQGPTVGIEEYFASHGFTCPLNHNPCDFIMNLCQSFSFKELEDNHLVMLLPEEYSSDRQSTKTFTIESIQFTFEASFLHQMQAIMYRGWLDLFRDYSTLVARTARNVVMGLLYGLIFMNIGHADNGIPDNIQSHVGAISMILMISMYYIAQSGMLNFQIERPMILREYVTGTYDIAAYFLGKTLIELPLNFALMMMFYSFFYFLMDLQGNFMYFVVTSWLVAISCNSLALMLGVSVSKTSTVTELASLVFFPQMLFSGVYVSTENIPMVIRWAQYLCSMKYGMNLALYNEFHPSMPSCDSDPVSASNCAAILASNNIHSSDIGMYIGCLLSLFVGYRVLAIIILYQKAKKFY